MELMWEDGIHHLDDSCRRLRRFTVYRVKMLDVPDASFAITECFRPRKSNEELQEATHRLALIDKLPPPRQSERDTTLSRLGLTLPVGKHASMPSRMSTDALNKLQREAEAAPLSPS